MDMDMLVFLLLLGDFIPVPVTAPPKPTPNPIFSWPLHAKSNIYEIVTGVPQDASQAGIMYGDSMYNNVETMAFDGVSYIDLNMDSYPFTSTKDYGYGVYLKTVELSNRCVFHHVHTGAGTDVTEFKVWIDLLDLHVSRTVNGVVETATVVGLVKLNTWQQVGFGFDQNTGKIAVYMEGQKIEFANWLLSKVLETPAKIRVGGCFDGSSMRFKGFITGLELFASKLDLANMPKFLTAYQDTTLQCYSETPELTSQTGGICPTTTTTAITTTTPIPPPTLTFDTTVYYSNGTVYSRRFALPEENVLPDVLLDMAYYPDCTVYTCGSRCMLDSACQSFSFHMLTATSGNCHLFADVYSAGLISSSQTYYYRLV